MRAASLSIPREELHAITATTSAAPRRDGRGRRLRRRQARPAQAAARVRAGRDARRRATAAAAATAVRGSRPGGGASDGTAVVRRPRRRAHPAQGPARRGRVDAGRVRHPEARDPRGGLIMTFGPMQVLVVGFDGTEFTGKIAAELRRLREHDIVRLVDLIVVRKEANGDVTSLETSDLTDAESAELGAFAGALVGLDAGDEDSEANGAPMLEDEVWFVA